VFCKLEIKLRQYSISSGSYGKALLDSVWNVESDAEHLPAAGGKHKRLERKWLREERHHEGLEKGLGLVIKLRLVSLWKE